MKAGVVVARAGSRAGQRHPGLEAAAPAAAGAVQLSQPAAGGEVPPQPATPRRHPGPPHHPQYREAGPHPQPHRPSLTPSSGHDAEEEALYT